ncbi:MAG: hypothetical protein HQ513_18465 [Rhodospirillales bacterium]|nr:hypothetical protein [Rhodospirillales bacterium]
MDMAWDLRETADIEEKTEGSRTTITSLRRGAAEIERLRGVLESIKDITEGPENNGRAIIEVYVVACKGLAPQISDNRTNTEGGK